MDEDREDPAELQTALSSMTDDEVFLAMKRFERASERDADPAYALAMIGLVETEIERRFPGQALAPYKVWQRDFI
jgi:hypothetical protein